MRKIGRLAGSSLVLILLCSLAPASFGKTASSKAVLANPASDPLSGILGILDPNKPKDPPPPPPGPPTQRAVPEGGSSLMYLGLAGFACIGTAIAVRARRKSAIESVL
jgi:hypothetical protein